MPPSRTANPPWHRGDRRDVDDTEGSTSVTTYTITITADDEAAATTRLRLEASGDQVILTDVHLHDGTGLSTGQLPAADSGLLPRAITPPTPPPLSSAPPAQSRAPARAPTGPAATAPARRGTRTAAAPKTRRGGRGSASVAAAAPQPAAGGRT